MADVLAICGSLRSGSHNRKLMRLMVRELRGLGLSVDEVDLKTLALPVYDGDDEHARGLPDAVKEQKSKLTATPGLLVVSPEYNSSVPGGFKNWIDWVSRPPGNPFDGRVVSVNGTSDGAFGTARANIAIRQIFTHLGSWVAPKPMTLPRADKAFDEQGELKEEWMKKGLAAAMQAFAEGVRRFKA